MQIERLTPYALVEQWLGGRLTPMESWLLEASDCLLWQKLTDAGEVSISIPVSIHIFDTVLMRADARSQTKQVLFDYTDKIIELEGDIFSTCLDASRALNVPLGRVGDLARVYEVVSELLRILQMNSISIPIKLEQEFALNQLERMVSALSTINQVSWGSAYEVAVDTALFEDHHYRDFHIERPFRRLTPVRTVAEAIKMKLVTGCEYYRIDGPVRIHASAKLTP